jgi:predicted aspartyl protease
MRLLSATGVAVFLTLTIGSVNARANVSLKHVLFEADGGAIEVEAKRVKDTQTRDAVREQLRHDVREQIPSATPAMQEHRNQIKYKYEETTRGGRIRIITKDQSALAAVQDYLRSEMTQAHNAKAATFKFIRGTSLVSVPVTINDRSTFLFLLDTGASSTILSSAAADRLGIPKGGNMTMLTAGGSLPVSLRNLESLQVANARLSRVEIAVAEVPLMQKLHVDGILGSDYLRRFKVTIDYDNELVEIEPNEPDSISIKMGLISDMEQLSPQPLKQRLISGMPV